MLVAYARHPELAAAAGPAARVEVRIEELLGAVDGTPEEGRGGDPRQGSLVRYPVVMTAPVDEVGGAGGAHVGVVEALEDRLDLRREMLCVHPVDRVGQRTQHAELAARREARAVFDVAGLLAVVPVHAGDPVLVRAHPGRDRGGAHGRDRGEGGDAVRYVSPSLSDLRQRGSPSERDRALEHGRLERVDHDQHELLGTLRRLAFAPAPSAGPHARPPLAIRPRLTGGRVSDPAPGRLTRSPRALGAHATLLTGPPSALT